MLIAIVPLYLKGTSIDTFALVDDKTDSWIPFDATVILDSNGSIVDGNVVDFFKFIDGFYLIKNENPALNIFLANQYCKNKWKILWQNIDFDEIVELHFPLYKDSIEKYKLIV